VCEVDARVDSLSLYFPAFTHTFYSDSFLEGKKHHFERGIRLSGSPLEALCTLVRVGLVPSRSESFFVLV
jgi:hypothetical protein